MDCWTDATRERWAETDAPDDRAEQLAWLRDRFGAVEGGHDTVGAVACDGERVATATSTGGRWFALAGRAGDVPQVGAGFYAGPAGAAGDAGLIVMGADGEAGEASTSAAMQTARS